MKFLPLSEWIVTAFPRREKKSLKAAEKAFCSFVAYHFQMKRFCRKANECSNVNFVFISILMLSLFHKGPQ